MANEASVQISLNIRKQDATTQVLLIDERTSDNFTATVEGTKGPCVGSVRVPTTGLDVDLSELTTPGLCRFKNQDPTNFVEYGIREPATGFFYPLGEILPGEGYVLRLSRNLLEEYTGTGTGTSAPTNYLHFKANMAAINVLIEVYEA